MLSVDMMVNLFAIQCEPLNIFSLKRATQHMPFHTHTHTHAALCTLLVYFADIIIFTSDSFSFTHKTRTHSRLFIFFSLFSFFLFQWQQFVSNRNKFTCFTAFPFKLYETFDIFQFRSQMFLQNIGIVVSVTYLHGT